MSPPALGDTIHLYAYNVNVNIGRDVWRRLRGDRDLWDEDADYATGRRIWGALFFEGLDAFAEVGAFEAAAQEGSRGA